MFKSRLRNPESTEKKRQLFLMKQYASEGANIPLQKNWLDSWCTLPQSFDTLLEDILNMEVRADDVFVVTFIKCGTTWMQETAWLLMNNLDFEKSKQLFIWERSPYMELHALNEGAPDALEYCKNLASPRVIKSHLQANLLPLQIWEKKQKIIYVARSCKDVVISSYHFLKNLGSWFGNGLEEFVDDFIDNQIMYSSYWSHIVDFWKMRHEPFVFFVTYEEMKKDLSGVLQRLSEFLSRPQLTSEEMENLLNHLSFAQMKDNKQTNVTNLLKEQIPTASEDFEFMRRGEVGSFRDELTPALQMKIDNWSREFLAQHDLTEEDIFGKL